MNKKMRFSAVILAFIMLVRYSEVGMLVVNAANSEMVYQSENIDKYSMIAQEIQLHYGTLYQGGIHSTDTKVTHDKRMNE